MYKNYLDHNFDTYLALGNLRGQSETSVTLEAVTRPDQRFI